VKVDDPFEELVNRIARGQNNCELLRVFDPWQDEGENLISPPQWRTE